MRSQATDQHMYGTGAKIFLEPCFFTLRGRGVDRWGGSRHRRDFPFWICQEVLLYGTVASLQPLLSPDDNVVHLEGLL